MQKLCRRLSEFACHAFGGLLDTLYPDCCPVCGRALSLGEELMCLGCRLDLPRTGLHHIDFNEIHRRLGSHVAIDKAMAWFWYYRDTPFTRLITRAKYADRPKLVRAAAACYARELEADGCPLASFADVVVPVAMHWRRRLQRGYNQSEYLGRGLADAAGLELVCCMRAVAPHGSQTRLTAEERLRNIAGTIELKSAAGVAGRRVLLVDDIITTGATLTAHAEALAAAGPASISILSLGLTHLH